MSNIEKVRKMIKETILNENINSIRDIINSFCLKYRCSVRKKKYSDLTKYIFKFLSGWSNGDTFNDKLDKHKKQMEFAENFIDDIRSEIDRIPNIKVSFSINGGSEFSVEMRIRNK